MRAGHRNAVTMRLAEDADADYVRCLSKKVFRQYGPYENILVDGFESGITETCLALIGKRPVGFAMLKKPGGTRYVERICELLAIAVEPEKWRLGIGDLLMTEVQRQAEEMQVDTLVLCTGLDNKPAQELFRKHGFTPLVLKKGYYPEGQDALMMYKNIS